MRSLVLSTLLLAVAPLAVTAGEKTKPNTLTPKQVSEGWILLFDGETTFGWNVEGEASVSDGWLVLGGKKASRAVCTTEFYNYLFHYEARSSAKGKPAPEIAVLYTSRGKDAGGLSDLITEKSPPGGQIRSWMSIEPKDYRTRFQLTVPAGEKLFIRNLKLKPLEWTSLFNGKDLTGWKVFADEKRNKSKFTVEGGAITVKDGPGDLQTEGKYGDFILKLECKSNGKHLNSGVFFRCRPNEYQNGYEAQVRNQFMPEPTQEYTVEKYDPKTHMLVGKEKIKSPAVDFGTGAIYRRVPARKAASKDGEWFTMTVVAHGNHFATWVNGVQQVDWTDHRPPSDNARTGYRREAGHLSIQGHDPTTDLSFRNLRIAELPAAK